MVKRKAARGRWRGGLFCAERFYRVEGGGAAGWDVAGEQGGDGEHGGDSGERWDVP